MARNSDKRGSQDHGGDIYQSGAPVIRDFSASINPLGNPEGLFQAVEASWAEVLHYPDRRSTGFIQAVADYFHVGREFLAAGNGSAELIDLLVRSSIPGRLLLCPPDFGLYERFVPAQTEIVRIPRLEEKGFALDLDRVADTLREGDLLLFSNPGNPSGHGHSREEVLALADRAARAGAKVVVDEAFCDFCPDISVLDRAGSQKALAVMRSMTKFYGIPGLRLGFLAADPAMVEAMETIRQPWSVSSIAQAVGVQCFCDRNWSEKSCQYVVRAREKFVAELQNLPGVTPLPSRANFLLVRLDPPAPDADRLYETLKEEGTLVRHCASFGLGGRYVRLAVRTVGENADLIRHMKKFFR